MDQAPNPSNTPLELGRIPEPSAPRVDNKAAMEEKFLVHELRHKQEMSETVHQCKRVLLVVSFGVIIAIILIRVWGLVAPTCWQWLSTEQNTRIDEFFLHGTIGAIVAGYLGKYFREERKD